MNEEFDLKRYAGLPEVPDQEVVDAIKTVPGHYSASLLVDFANTITALPSLPSASVAADAGIAILSGGGVSSLSGVLVGDIIDLLNANTFQNVYITGRSIGSGPLVIGIQTSDSTTSGTFTDPTSGLQTLPVNVSSGGQIIVGSGGWTGATDPGGIFGSGVSGQMVLSGFFAAAAFQRGQRYARLNVNSGFMDVVGFQAGFMAQSKSTGSGGGQTQSPGSGLISV